MLTLLLALTNAFAATNVVLKVESPKLNYFLKIDKDHFEYSSNTKKIKQPIKACGAVAFETFANKINREIKTEIMKSKKKTARAYQVAFNNGTYFILPLSSAGIFLSKVEGDVDYVISEAIYRCSKK